MSNEIEQDADLRKTRENDKIKPKGFIMQVAMHLRCYGNLWMSRKCGHFYDKINADAFIMEVASQLRDVQKAWTFL